MGLEDLVEGFIAGFPEPCQLNRRERQLLTQNWDVPRTEDGKRVRLHLLNVPLNQRPTRWQISECVSTDYSSQRRNRSAPLVPPNPNEFDMAYSTSALRAWLGT